MPTVPLNVLRVVAGGSVDGNMSPEDLKELTKGFQEDMLHQKMKLKDTQLIDSFCKRCGTDIRDFHVPDELWKKVEKHIDNGHSLCYNCFVELCEELGLPVSYELIPMEGSVNHVTVTAAEAEEMMEKDAKSYYEKQLENVVNLLEVIKDDFTDSLKDGTLKVQNGVDEVFLTALDRLIGHAERMEDFAGDKHL